MAFQGNGYLLLCAKRIGFVNYDLWGATLFGRLYFVSLLISSAEGIAAKNPKTRSDYECAEQSSYSEEPDEGKRLIAVSERRWL